MKSLIKSEITRTIDSLSKQLNALNHVKRSKIKPNAMFRITNDINKMHYWFFGDIDKRPNNDNIKKVTNKIVNGETNLLLLLFQCIHHLQFNTAKQIANIIKYIITNCKRNKCHYNIKMLTDINDHNPIIQSLINQYNQNCSEILCEMVKQHELLEMITTLKVHYPGECMEVNTGSFTFVDVMLMLIQSPDLVISIAASETLNAFLTTDDDIACDYLHSNFTVIFDKITDILIDCDNFMVKKRLIRLVYGIVMNNKHCGILIRYIQNKRYLLVVMDLMIQYKLLEAWHIFKLFVANKHQQKDIDFVLWKHKTQLITFLSSFCVDKYGKTFALEKRFVMGCLRGDHCGLLMVET